MLGLRTTALKISFGIASVFGLLAKLVDLEVQTVLLKNLLPIMG